MRIHQNYRRALILSVLINSLLLTTGCKSQEYSQDCPEVANSLSADFRHKENLWNPTSNYIISSLRWSPKLPRPKSIKPKIPHRKYPVPDLIEPPPRKPSTSIPRLIIPDDELGYLAIADNAIRRAEKKLAGTMVLHKTLSVENKLLMQNQVRQIVVKHGKLSLYSSTDSLDVGDKFQDIAEQVLTEIDYVTEYTNRIAEDTAVRLVQSGVENHAILKTTQEEVEKVLNWRLKRWQQRRRVLYVSASSITGIIINAAVNSAVTKVTPCMAKNQVTPRVR